MGVALAALLIDNLPKIDVGMAGLKNIDYVLRKLAWMRSQRIWPNGLRYLWTDAFGLVLLVSLYGAPNEEPYLDGAMELVAEVDRVLGRKRGIRIGEEPDRDGQYFHYLAMWLYALGVLGRYEPAYRDKGIARVPSTGLSSCGPRCYLENEGASERTLSRLRLRRP
jgi:hypothetical protein